MTQLSEYVLVQLRQWSGEYADDLISQLSHESRQSIMKMMTLVDQQQWPKIPRDVMSQAILYAIGDEFLTACFESDTPPIERPASRESVVSTAQAQVFGEVSQTFIEGADRVEKILAETVGLDSIKELFDPVRRCADFLDDLDRDFRRFYRNEVAPITAEIERKQVELEHVLEMIRNVKKRRADREDDQARSEGRKPPSECRPKKPGTVLAGTLDELLEDAGLDRQNARAKLIHPIVRDLLEPGLGADTLRQRLRYVRAQATEG